jgi:cytochrome P450
MSQTDEHDARAPAPRGLPYFGCVGALRRNPMEFFRRVAVRFGGIARVPLQAGRSLYLVSEPKLIKELLLDHRTRFVKNTRYPAMQRLLGTGLLLSEGEGWRRQRLLTQPAFKPSELKRQIGWMSGYVTRYLDSWEQHARSGAPLDAELEFLKLTQLLAGVLVIGPGFEQDAPEMFRISEAIKNNWPVPPRGILSGFRKPSPERAQRLEDACSELDRLLLSFVERQRKAAPEDGGILGMLIADSEKEGQPFTDKELRDQVATLFFAGYETSAASMCWTHYLLSAHPDVREKLLREVDDKLGGTTPTGEDLERLDYVERVRRSPPTRTRRARGSSAHARACAPALVTRHVVRAAHRLGHALDVVGIDQQRAARSCSAAPANSDSTSTQSSSMLQAQYSLATRFMPSLSGVTSAMSAAR